jgi:hypothetical protein
VQLFAPRQLISLPLITRGEWDIRQHAVVYGNDAFDASRFVAPVEAALASLPQPARTASRLGVGFVIQHQGRGMDYLVLGWWDRENELPLRIWVDERNGEGWRAARGEESVCVWDLEILWTEREAYVGTIMSSHDPAARGAYLSYTRVLP